MTATFSAEDVQLLTKAFNFAAERHVHQRRKGAHAEPYINHPIAVAGMLAAAGEDAKTIAAGILHDTVEDVGVTYGELLRTFGSEVADAVMEVTDDKKLPKEERKQLQITTAKHKSARARKIKIADKTANLQSLLTSPPGDWDQKRITDYFKWAKQVVDQCRGLNEKLEQDFDATYNRRMLPGA